MAGSRAAWGLVACVAIACSKVAPSAGTETRTPIDGLGAPTAQPAAMLGSRERIGEFIGSWDPTAQTLTFTPAERDSSGELVPQEISKLGSSIIEVDQQASAYTTSTSGVAVGTFTCAMPASSNKICGASKNQACAATVCASVELAEYKTATPHAYDDVILDVNKLTNNWVVSGDDYAGLSSGLQADILAADGFTTSTRIADWDFARIAPAPSSSANGTDTSPKLLQFNSAVAGAAFSFGVTAYGRRSYTVTSDANFTSSDPFYDAAGNAGRSWQPNFNVTNVSSGATKVISNAMSATISATLTSPFQLSVFEQTGTSFWVSSSGILGLGTAPASDPTPAGGAQALPYSGVAANNYAIYPFWSQLTTGSWLANGDVYWNTTGTTPNRKLVVTWANMTFTTTQVISSKNCLVDEYFSVEIDETTNAIHVQSILPGVATANTVTIGCGLFADAFGSAGSGGASAATTGIQGASDAALVYANLGVLNSALGFTQQTYSAADVIFTTNLLPNSANLNLTFTP
jgi:hypothetical protein